MMNKLTLVFLIGSFFIFGCFAGKTSTVYAIQQPQKNEAFYVYDSITHKLNSEHHLEKNIDKHIFITTPIWVEPMGDDKLYAKPQKMVWQVNEETNKWTIEIIKR